MRQRVCLEGRNALETCDSTPPAGLASEMRECLPLGITCDEKASFSPWSEWDNCHMGCIPRDGSQLSVKYRKRSVYFVFFAGLDPNNLHQKIHESQQIHNSKKA